MEDKVRVARQLAYTATGIIIFVALIALVFREQAIDLVKQYDGAFKIIGLGFGPLIAILTFFWGLLDKAEIKQLSHQLGSATTEAREERRRVDDEQRRVSQVLAEVETKQLRIRELESALSKIADYGRLWGIRAPQPFSEYRAWKYDPFGAKIVTIGLFKGGVGKTHLAANFAAYVSERQQKPVLIVDLDYQGSLSTMMLSASDMESPGSNVDALFAEDADLATLSSKRVHLSRRGDRVALNRGAGLANAWLVPAEYTLAPLESRLLTERVFHESSVLDERFRLAHVLLNPHVRREYAMIIIDTPPRMTLSCCRFRGH
jgi:hypothetical protein